MLLVGHAKNLLFSNCGRKYQKVTTNASQIDRRKKCENVE